MSADAYVSLRNCEVANYDVNNYQFNSTKPGVCPAYSSSETFSQYYGNSFSDNCVLDPFVGKNPRIGFDNGINVSNVSASSVHLPSTSPHPLLGYNMMKELSHELSSADMEIVRGAVVTLNRLVTTEVSSFLFIKDFHVVGTLLDVMSGIVHSYASGFESIESQEIVSQNEDCCTDAMWEDSGFILYSLDTLMAVAERGMAFLPGFNCISDLNNSSSCAKLSSSDFLENIKTLDGVHLFFLKVTSALCSCIGEMSRGTSPIRFVLYGKFIYVVSVFISWQGYVAQHLKFLVLQEDERVASSMGTVSGDPKLFSRARTFLDVGAAQKQLFRCKIRRVLCENTKFDCIPGANQCASNGALNYWCRVLWFRTGGGFVFQNKHDSEMITVQTAECEKEIGVLIDHLSNPTKGKVGKITAEILNIFFTPVSHIAQKFKRASSHLSFMDAVSEFWGFIVQHSLVHLLAPELLNLEDHKVTLDFFTSVFGRVLSNPPANGKDGLIFSSVLAITRALLRDSQCGSLISPQELRQGIIVQYGSSMVDALRSNLEFISKEEVLEVLRAMEENSSSIMVSPWITSGILCGLIDLINPIGERARSLLIDSDGYSIEDPFPAVISDALYLTTSVNISRIGEVSLAVLSMKLLYSLFTNHAALLTEDFTGDTFAIVKLVLPMCARVALVQRLPTLTTSKKITDNKNVEAEVPALACINISSTSLPALRFTTLLECAIGVIDAAIELPLFDDVVSPFSLLAPFLVRLWNLLSHNSSFLPLAGSLYRLLIKTVKGPTDLLGLTEQVSNAVPQAIETVLSRSAPVLEVSSAAQWLCSIVNFTLTDPSLLNYFDLTVSALPRSVLDAAVFWTQNAISSNEFVVPWDAPAALFALVIALVRQGASKAVYGGGREESHPSASYALIPLLPSGDESIQQWGELVRNVTNTLTRLSKIACNDFTQFFNRSYVARDSPHRYLWEMNAVATALYGCSTVLRTIRLLLVSIPSTTTQISQADISSLLLSVVCLPAPHEITLMLALRHSTEELYCPRIITGYSTLLTQLAEFLCIVWYPTLAARRERLEPAVLEKLPQSLCTRITDDRVPVTARGAFVAIAGATIYSIASQPELLEPFHSVSEEMLIASVQLCESSAQYKVAKTTPLTSAQKSALFLQCQLASRFSAANSAALKLGIVRSAIKELLAILISGVKGSGGSCESLVTREGVWTGNEDAAEEVKARFSLVVSVYGSCSCAKDGSLDSFYEEDELRQIGHIIFTLLGIRTNSPTVTKRGEVLSSYIEDLRLCAVKACAVLACTVPGREILTLTVSSASSYAAANAAKTCYGRLITFLFLKDFKTPPCGSFLSNLPPFGVFYTGIDVVVSCIVEGGSFFTTSLCKLRCLEQVCKLLCAVTEKQPTELRDKEQRAHALEIIMSLLRLLTAATLSPECTEQLAGSPEVRGALVSSYSQSNSFLNFGNTSQPRAQEKQMLLRISSAALFVIRNMCFCSAAKAGIYQDSRLLCILKEALIARGNTLSSHGTQMRGNPLDRAETLGGTREARTPNTDSVGGVRESAKFSARATDELKRRQNLAVSAMLALVHNNQRAAVALRNILNQPPSVQLEVFFAFDQSDSEEKMGSSEDSLRRKERQRLVQELNI